MEQALKEQLKALAEPEYQVFAAALIPNIQNVMGVRLPALRKIAKKLAIQQNWETICVEAPQECFEETMVHGMVIGYLKSDIEDVLRHVTEFVPRIDNWSVCDSFCSGLKITLKHKDRMWLFLQPYSHSSEEYDVRFAVVMMLNYYMEDHYLSEVLERLDRIRHEGYYVKMAVAWAISICYIKSPVPTMAYLQANTLDRETFNKALQKITESYRVDPETKRLIRSMKRK